MENNTRRTVSARPPLLHPCRRIEGMTRDDKHSNRDNRGGVDSIKVAICPRCGADGIKIGITSLPDSDEVYEQYCCLKCGHGFMLREEDSDCQEIIRGADAGIMRS